MVNNQALANVRLTLGPHSSQIVHCVPVLTIF